MEQTNEGASARSAWLEDGDIEAATVTQSTQSSCTTDASTKGGDLSSTTSKAVLYHGNDEDRSTTSTEAAVCGRKAERALYYRAASAEERSKYMRLTRTYSLLAVVVLIVPLMVLTAVTLGGESYLGFCFGLVVGSLYIVVLAKLVAKKSGTVVVYAKMNPKRKRGASDGEKQQQEPLDLHPGEGPLDLHPCKRCQKDPGPLKEPKPTDSEVNDNKVDGKGNPQQHTASVPSPPPGPAKLTFSRRFGMSCELCGVRFDDWVAKDRHMRFDIGHLEKVYAKEGLALDDQAAEEAFHQLAVAKSLDVGDIDYSKVSDSARMCQREYYDSVVEMALHNYERYHNMSPGTATYTLVASTSAGIHGWAACAISDVPTSTDNAKTARGDTEDGQPQPNIVPVPSDSKKGASKGDKEEAQMVRLALMESMLEDVGVCTPSHEKVLDHQDVSDSDSDSGSFVYSDA